MCLFHSELIVPGGGIVQTRGGLGGRGENCDTCCLDKGNCTYPENYQRFPVLAVIYQRTGGRTVLLVMDMSGSIHCFGYGLKGGICGIAVIPDHQFTHKNIPQPQFNPIQKPRSENPQFLLSLHRVLFVSPRPKAVYPVQLGDFHDGCCLGFRGMKGLFAG